MQSFASVLSSKARRLTSNTSSSHALNGIGQVGLETGIPVTCGVLTTYTVAEATDRAGGKAGNKGFEAAAAAIEMATLFSSMPKERPRALNAQARRPQRFSRARHLRPVRSGGSQDLA